MVSSDSVISDFYPHAFETDLNGKKNEWEAVVLIPFIFLTRFEPRFLKTPLKHGNSRQQFLTAREGSKTGSALVDLILKGR